MSLLSGVYTSFSSGNVEILLRRSADKIKDKIEEPRRTAGTGPIPEWLNSASSFALYQISPSKYITAAESQDVDMTVSAEDEFSTVEVPIVSPNRLERIVISVNEERKKLLIDDNFNYPEVMWIPINIESCQKATIKISLTQSSMWDFSKLLDQFRDSVSTSPTSGLPAINSTADRPPVFLISLDTLRYDAMDEMTPLLDEMGPTATIPDEPRTQGFWTPQSHGCMFTGTHPGDHGYVGVGSKKGDERPIDPEMETISSVLGNRGYKNSAIVSHSRVQPQYGFGRMFHRFVCNQAGGADWVKRSTGAREQINTVIKWIDKDVAQRNDGLFYFIHLFDPHFPYMPPSHFCQSKHVDFSAPWKYGKLQSTHDKTMNDDYINKFKSDPELPDELIDLMQSHYRDSVAYTARHVSRLIRHLKSCELFDSSLILIVGDHGEEWGERGFFHHSSLITL